MRKPGSNSAETRRRLGTAAIQLLFQHGYAAMDLRTLARSVDLQVGSLYNYFDSKQHLLFWLLKDNTEKILAELDKTIARTRTASLFVRLHNLRPRLAC